MRFEGKIPDNLIKERPVLKFGLELFYQAFFELNYDRQSGMDIGYIPWTSIRLYVEYHEFDKELSNEAFFFIRGLDNAYVKYCKEQQAKNVKKSK